MTTERILLSPRPRVRECLVVRDAVRRTAAQALLVKGTAVLTG